MNKEELVRVASRRLKLPESHVDEVLDGILDSIRLSLATGEAVNIRRFGSFEPRNRRAHTKKLPTGGTTEVPQHITVVFRPSRLLKKRVHGER